MIKSLTVTYFDEQNYGASLQAYALQKVLERHGHENRLLSCTDRNFHEKSSLKIYLKQAFLGICRLFHHSAIRRQKEGFASFISRNLKVTETFESMDELREYCKDVDLVVLGSDQVLAPAVTGNREKVFCLEFVPEGIPRFCYAASLTGYNLPEERLRGVIQCLGECTGRSLRENKTVEFLSGHGLSDLRKDIDPVFLLGKQKWEEIMVRPGMKEKYLLFFQVNSNPVAQEVIDFYKKKYHLKTVCVQTNAFVQVKVDKVVLDASPEEFLGLIYDAEVVITTSFHGTAFSILFEKEFVTLSKPSVNPTRILDLLESFGLKERLVRGSEECERLDKPDYDRVRIKLEEYVTSGLEYIDSMEKVL